MFTLDVHDNSLLQSLVYTASHIVRRQLQINDRNRAPIVKALHQTRWRCPWVRRVCLNLLSAYAKTKDRDAFQLQIRLC